MQGSHIVYMGIELGSILLCWWALHGAKIEKVVRIPGSAQARMLHLIVAVILGHHFAAFLLSFAHISWVVFPEKP